MEISLDAFRFQTLPPLTKALAAKLGPWLYLHSFFPSEHALVKSVQSHFASLGLFKQN